MIATTTPVTLPKPGIHPNVPFEEYLRWPAISNSSLQLARRSMAHYRTRQPVEETPAMRLGSLVHAGKFEPLTIPQRFVVMPDYTKDVKTAGGKEAANPKATKDYKSRVAAFEAANSTKSIVTQAEYDLMLAMLEALVAHQRASWYLTGGQNELSILAYDPETGLPCKGRLDHCDLNRCIVSDLKSTADATRCEGLIVNRGWDRQVAFYGDLLTWVGAVDRIDEYALVVIESVGPHHGIKAAPLSDGSVKDGRAEYRRLLNQIAECEQTGRWPSYESPKAWERPGWAIEKPSLDLDWTGVNLLGAQS